MTAPSRQPDLFTAARIAEALGEDPQVMALRLRGTPFSAQVQQNGQSVRAWAWRALDEQTRRLLEARALAAGYSSGEALLLHASPDWLSFPRTDRERAARLCRALRQALAAHRGGQDLAAVLPLAAEGYRAEFGYQVKPVTLAKLLARVVEVDAGLKQFDRLHLYLPEERLTLAGSPSGAEPGMLLLGDRLAGDPLLVDIWGAAELTLNQKNILLSVALRHLENAIAEHPERRAGAIKMSLVDLLRSHFPTLSRSREALRRLLDRRYDVWQAGGRHAEAFLDGRKYKVERPYHVCPDCLKKIHDAAVRYNREGSVALAYRELRKRGLLCETCMAGIKFDLRKDKSYLPRGLRRRVTPAKLTRAFFRNPRDAELIGPHPEGDYSGLHAGDVFTADDWTTNEVVYEELPPKGSGRYEFYRVQVIIGTDVRSAKVLDFVAHFGHPYGWSIQKLNWAVFSTVGMPRKGLHLERGVFQSAIARQGTWENAFDLRLTFDRFTVRGADASMAREVMESLRVWRARLPTAKTIEGEIGNLQRRTALLPGHVGFNERLDNHKPLQDFMSRCRVGKEDPRTEGFLTIDDLTVNYRRVMEEYNSEPQNGRRLRGASPNELWAQHLEEGGPLEALPQALYYLFSTHRVQAKVHSGGITLNKVDGIEDARYYGAKRLGELEGCRVEVFYNRLVPDFITVRVSPKESFVLKRQNWDRYGASREEQREMQRARWNHMEYSRLRAANLSHPMLFTVEREDRFPESQLEMGRQHNEAVATADAERDQDAREIGAIRRRARAQGLLLDRQLDLNDPRSRLAVQLQLDALQRPAEEETP